MISQQDTGAVKIACLDPVRDREVTQDVSFDDFRACTQGSIELPSGEYGVAVVLTVIRRDKAHEALSHHSNCEAA